MNSGKVEWRGGKGKRRKTLPLFHFSTFPLFLRNGKTAAFGGTTYRDMSRRICRVCSAAESSQGGCKCRGGTEIAHYVWTNGAAVTMLRPFIDGRRGTVPLLLSEMDCSTSGTRPVLGCQLLTPDVSAHIRAAIVISRRKWGGNECHPCRGVRK